MSEARVFVAYLVLSFLCISCQSTSSPIGNTPNEKGSIHKYISEYSESINISLAIKDITLGLPTSHVTLLFDTFRGKHYPDIITKRLNEAGVTTTVYLIENERNQEMFCEYTKESLHKYEDSTNIVFSSRNTAVDLFWMMHSGAADRLAQAQTIEQDVFIQQRDLIHRKLLYIFYWGRESLETSFTMDHFEAMRIALITNPRPGTYRVYYSQGEASGNNKLTMVNWWSTETGLFRKPVLLPAIKVYQDFKGRVFDVPVLHKPPWNFVSYNNDSFKPEGGRDDKLLTVIAEKLNFKYRYIDPQERIQGSAMTKNGTFPGVLGQVWQRNVDFFMGDVTITYERNRVIEFSFFTLVDSEAFVTHRPSKLNEAFALIRPFQWQVWPPILITIALYGPFLYCVIEAPNMWRKKQKPREEKRKLLLDCIWFGTATFLRQGGKQPGSSHKVRLVLILTSLGATYVIGDMYSANLTSLLARPVREKPITTLEDLEVAMSNRGYELLVEKHSSSFSTLQNGTGIYKRLWDKMQTQTQSVIESVEVGMKLVREKKNFAVLGGRETLYFDSKRFGSYNFQLSEKLNTRYSAIAMQLGCPYIENFNRILMQLFEGGILTKMTEEEYEKLGEKQRAAAGLGETDKDVAEAQKELQNRGEPSVAGSDIDKPEENKKSSKGLHILGLDNDYQLQPLNPRMLQGAFYVLIIGYILGAISLIFEKNIRNFQQIWRSQHCRKCKTWLKTCDCSRWKCLWYKWYSQKLTLTMQQMLQNPEDIAPSKRHTY